MRYFLRFFFNNPFKFRIGNWFTRGIWRWWTSDLRRQRR